MCGSRPLAEAVTRSTGGAASLLASAARRAAIRALAASASAEFVGPRLEPVELAALYGSGLPSASVVAERRGQKNRGSSKGWPISVEPPELGKREPLAFPWKHACAIAVTTAG